MPPSDPPTQQRQAPAPSADLVYISYDLSRHWHIAHRHDLSRSLCGQRWDAHGAPGWPRTVDAADKVYGQYPAVCRECSGRRPIAPQEAIRVGTRVLRRDPRERRTVGVVVALLAATQRQPACARVRWEQATRRFSGSTHTTSTVRIDRLIPAGPEEVAR
jgi:hypothetical protein